jgi:hypothetical protein
MPMRDSTRWMWSATTMQQSSERHSTPFRPRRRLNHWCGLPAGCHSTSSSACMHHLFHINTHEVLHSCTISPMYMHARAVLPTQVMCDFSVQTYCQRAACMHFFPLSWQRSKRIRTQDNELANALDIRTRLPRPIVNKAQEG